jgi:hypothetical protein
VNLDEEMAQRLSSKAEAVLFIVSSFASNNPNSWDLLRFAEYVHNFLDDNSSISTHSLFSVLSARRLVEIADDRYLVPDYNFPEFVSREAKQDMLTSLEAKLDSAIQALSASPPYHCGLNFI